jgi:hypothetical protein
MLNNQVGTVHMYYKDSLVKSLNPDSPDVPMVGDVAFFSGAEQPYKTLVDETGVTAKLGHLMYIIGLLNAYYMPCYMYIIWLLDVYYMVTGCILYALLYVYTIHIF